MGLSQAKKIERRHPDQFGYDVAAAATIHKGALVVLDAGYAKPASTAVGLIAAGIAGASADNSGGANGDVLISVKRGCFKLVNSGADAIDRTHIGGIAYIVDDETVAATDGAGTRSAAGTIRAIDADGVWVEI